MDKKLADAEFVVFDVETTGLEPQSGDRIIEIAAIKVKGQKELSRFYSLVNPRRKISQEAFQINRISDEMLNDAPTSKIVLPEFIEFVEGSCLVGYNVGFDLGFIDYELELMGKKGLSSLPIIDVLAMTKRLLSGRRGGYSLGYVAQDLGISVSQLHRAMTDAELTFKIFNHLLETTRQKGIEDFLKFYSLFGFNTALIKSINDQKIASIIQAIDLGARLKMRYFSPGKGEVTEREVIPKQIFQQKDKDYLVGFCQLRKEERNFRIDGILHLEIL